jgi:porin
VRAGTAPCDRNLIGLYADAGVTFKGLLPLRLNDTIGMALAFARISPQVAAAMPL